MTKNKWAHHGDRIKFVVVISSYPNLTREIYFCLDNKFHSWGVREHNHDHRIAKWYFSIVHGDPNNSKLCYFKDWLYEISQ